jgi:dTMP kinase
LSGARPGRFITLEGGEGAGKTTQTRHLAAFLQSRGYKTLETREPGGAPGADRIRALLLAPAPERWDALTEALLHTAARREHLVARVWPALAEGRMVICDRFFDSTLAYQGYGSGLDREVIAKLTKLAVGDFAPDLTLVLDQPAEAGLARVTSRGEVTTRYERMGRDFHERVRQGFLAIARGAPERCVVIDATKDIETVARAVEDAVGRRLGLASK